MPGLKSIEESKQHTVCISLYFTTVINDKIRD